jgi:DNA-directed RNA polymerase specialized sigma24 family protein
VEYGCILPGCEVAKEMTKAPSLQKHETDLYATHEDFHSIFSEGLRELYKLSFLLTRDPEKAERCLVTGLDDCVTGNRIFREWARSWAKRAIIQNAIRELKPRPNHSNSPISGATFPDGKQLLTDPGLDFEMDAMFRLEDFERFVLIMSVLEHYSEHDCALLLGCSSREIREGRARALQELTDSSRNDFLQNQHFQQETR